MRGWRGLLSGVLGLVALQVVVSTSGSANRVGSGLTDVASLLRRALSPAVPLVPDLRGASSGTSARPTVATAPPADPGAAPSSVLRVVPTSLPRLAARPAPVLSVVSA